MIKQLIMTLAGFAPALFSHAQSEVWSLDRCMQYAVMHSESVLKKQYAQASDRENVKAAKAAFFPSIAAQTGGAWNWGRSVDPETNTYNNITTFNNAYDVYASFTVFDGGQTFNQLKQAKVALSRGMSDLQKAKDDKALAVMQAWIDATYYQACIGVAEDKLTDSRDILRKVEREHDLGRKSMPDVAQVKAQVAEDVFNLTHQKNLYNAAMLALKSEMNFPMADSLPLSGTLREIKCHFTDHEMPLLYGHAAARNPAAVSARLNVEQSRLQYKIEKGKLWPSLTLAAGVATSYYRNLSGGTTAFSFGNQFRNNMGEYFSATLTIPLFDRLQGRSSLRKARNNVLIAELEERETLRNLQKDMRQAVLDRDGYAGEMQCMEEKVAADSLAYTTTKRKFEEGMVSATDLRTNAQTLLQSKVTLLQKRLLYVLKARLVTYYADGQLINK